MSSAIKIQNLPAQLRWRLKAEAAARQLTLAEFILEVLEAAVPAPKGGGK